MWARVEDTAMREKLLLAGACLLALGAGLLTAWRRRRRPRRPDTDRGHGDPQFTSERAGSGPTTSRNVR
jgi:hypothetical protein